MVIPLYGGRHTARSNCAAVDSSCYMADGRLRKNNAVRIVIDVTQACLQIALDDNSVIWRTPYSENRPAGWIRATAWQTDDRENQCSKLKRDMEYFSFPYLADIFPVLSSFSMTAIFDLIPDKLHIPIQLIACIRSAVKTACYFFHHFVF